MKQLLLTVLALASIPGARASDPLGPVTSVRQQSEPDPAQVLAELLNGREAVVRLYDRWRDDPRAYMTLDVPLQGSDVTFDAVRLAYAHTRSDGAAAIPAEELVEPSDQAKAALDQELKEAMIVIVPGDQRDEAVCAALGDCLFGERYRSGQRFPLRPGSTPWMHANPCVFRDALQQPIANAEVEILIGDQAQHMYAPAKVWIANARLDADGRMQSPKTASITGLRYLLFVLLHPDCGPVPAVLQYASSKPGVEHVLTVGALPRDKWCVFLDALGAPMAGATVEVFSGWTWPPRSGSPTYVTTLDQGGRLRPPDIDTRLENCCFLVSDPNYGMAIVEPWDQRIRHSHDELLTTCVVPLTRAGTKADERSIWGMVVDPNGRPVPGAVIQSFGVRVPGMGELQAFFPGSYHPGKYAKVLTDTEGRFLIHLPLAKSDGTLGRPVPPKAQYTVTIEAPKELGLHPYRGLLAAGEEHTITLESQAQSPKSFSGTLLFEDEFGPVIDEERLRQVSLTIRVPIGGGRYTGAAYPSGSWMGRKELAFGLYRATTNWNGKHYVFGPVEVTAQSPEVIVFKPVEVKAAETVYRGRVIHGITGAPVAQAVVLQRPWPRSRPIPPDFASEDMEQLTYFGPETDPDGELFRVIEQQLDLPITRTDSAGRFEVTLPTGERGMLPNSIIAIKKDFLGFEQQLSLAQSRIAGGPEPQSQAFPPDGTGTVPLPDMKLFPAGTVVIEPNTPLREGWGSGKWVRFQYLTTAGDPTPWLKDLWARPPQSQGGSVFRKDKLPANRLQRVYVPADVTLKLRIDRLDERSAPVVIEGVRLAQGQVMELGRVDFPPALQVAVRVVDSAGKPLEGINVLCQDKRGRGAVTNGDGIAHLFVVPNSEGYFIVECWDKETRRMVWEGAPYRVAGPQDAGREFVLPLSDAFVKQLFDSQASR